MAHRERLRLARAGHPDHDLADAVQDGLVRVVVVSAGAGHPPPVPVGVGHQRGPVLRAALVIVSGPPAGADQPAARDDPLPRGGLPCRAADCGDGVLAAAHQLLSGPGRQLLHPVDPLLPVHPDAGHGGIGGGTGCIASIRLPRPRSMAARRRSANHCRHQPR